MDETTRVSNLIGEIYDAALDRSLWPGLLEQTCAYVGGLSAGLIVHEPSRQSAQFYVSWGCNPDYRQSYREKYARMHSAAQLVRIYSKIGDVAAYLDFMSADEFHATRFYKEWAGPQGHVDAVQTTLDKSAAGHAEIAVVRHERHGVVDAEARRRMQMLAPHFRRAVAVGKVLEHDKVEADSFADTLDGLAAALFLVDADGRIVHANASGEAMLGHVTVLESVGGRLAARDGEADQALRAALADAGDTTGTKGIAIPMEDREASRWIAHVLPLTSGARRAAGASYAAVAAIFVRKADFEPPPLEAVARLYALTPTEMRVLLGVVKIGGVPEIAPVLGVSESTVKTHLQRIFLKTGVNRQADLVKLTAGFASPLLAASPLADLTRTDDADPARARVS